MNLTSRIPLNTQNLLKAIGGIADKRGIRAYAVGGFVRDLILGKENNDLDIVVEGDAIALAKEFACLKTNGKPTVHRQFGTATMRLHKPHTLRIDFATARKEVYKKPASYPQVSPGSIKDDLFRRDITINAMAISLNKNSFGRLIDLFGGMEDLNKKSIRVLHDKSFIDDPSRILRAIRFEQRFHFALERQTRELMGEAIKSGYIERLNIGRVRKEMALMAKERDPLKCIKRLCELGRT